MDSLDVVTTGTLNYHLKFSHVSFEGHAKQGNSATASVIKSSVRNPIFPGTELIQTIPLFFLYHFFETQICAVCTKFSTLCPMAWY